MCGSSDKVSMFKGRRDGFGCHQATDMGHVSKHVGLDVSAQLREKKCEKEGRKTKLRLKYIQYGQFYRHEHTNLKVSA